MYRLRHDEGTVTTLVVVVLGLGMLLGLGAVVIDYGAQLAERRQVQNGADAAAVALALACAQETPCSPDASQADAWVSVNDSADDVTGAAQVFSVCSHLSASVCSNPSGGGALTSCLPGDAGIAADALGWVEVRVTSDQPVLMGGSLGSDGTSAAACSRASYGPVGAVEEALVIAVPVCAFASGPGGDPFTGQVELAVAAPEPAPTGTCSETSLESFAVAGDGDDGCRLSAEVGDTIEPADQGSVEDCVTDLPAGGAAWLAVYGVEDDGRYRVLGFTGFVPADDPIATCTTADPPPAPAPEPEPAPEPAEQVCVVGTFVRGTPPGGRIGPGRDFGARAVQLTG